MLVTNLASLIINFGTAISGTNNFALSFTNGCYGMGYTSGYSFSNMDINVTAINNQSFSFRKDKSMITLYIAIGS